MEFEPKNEKIVLTPEDLQDREDFQYLLSIMEKQHAVGITQPVDYKDAITYRNESNGFLEKEKPEGMVSRIFDNIIFDFDGVIYDSTYSAYRAVELILKEKAGKDLPIPSTNNEIANSYQAPFKNYYKRFGISLDTPEEIESFKNTYRKIQSEIDKEYHTPARLYPEVKFVLEKLKEEKKNNPNLRIHIISAGSEDQVKGVLLSNDIIDDFDEIHTECHDKIEAIKSIDDKSETKEKTVMIGDLPSDIKDAQKIDGISTIAVARGLVEKERLGMYLPDYIVSDLSGLLNLKSYSKELSELNKNNL